MKPIFARILLVALAGLPATLPAYDSTDMNICLKQAIATAPDDTTVGELRSACAAQLAGSSGIALRHRKELSLRDNRFAITAHRPNYLLLAAHDTRDSIDAGLDPGTGKDTESHFQVSMKFPVWQDLAGIQRLDLYAAYTNRSFWQVYDQANSAPFRETNHEPELWLSAPVSWRMGGLTNRAVRLGLSHQSNGRSGDLSRSWNRLFGELIFDRGHYSGSLKTWWRLPEKGDDDNPDIEDYLGIFQLTNVLSYKKHSFSAMLRAALESGMRGTAQLDWTFPLGDRRHFAGHLQWFNGYGYSLIDYDHRVNVFGIGVSLTDWL